jgi:glycosyltransferase involved in cell wall biosynthesis
MNILLINHYAGSPNIGMEYRPYYMALEWQKNKNNVLVITASFSHFRVQQFLFKGNYKKFNVEDVDYYVIKTPKYSGHGVGRVINLLAFVFKLFIKSNNLATEYKPDVVIASSTYVFDIYIAKRICRKTGAKLVFEVHDLWPLSIIELGGYSRFHPFIFLMWKAEKYAYKNSDKVISLLPNAKEYMVENGLQPAKFVHIPNGINLEDWNSKKEIPKNISNLIVSLKKQNKVIIGYAGTHGLANALDSLIDAMKILEDTNIELLLIGQGTEKQNLVKQAADLKINNVNFIDPVPRDIVPSILVKLDILYIGLQNQPLFRFGISPNKLIDYMMSGKPIVQAIKAGNDLVTEVGCGITVEPENPLAIAKAVKHLIHTPSEELKKMGSKGRQYCKAHLDYKVLATNCLEAFE